MLTELYIEALLVDEELADRVWEAWDAGELAEPVALWAWWLVSELTLMPAGSKQGVRTDNLHNSRRSTPQTCCP